MKKPRLSLDTLPPPSTDPIGPQRLVEVGEDACPCGMPVALDVAKHGPSCAMRKATSTVWRPPVSLEEAPAAPVRAVAEAAPVVSKAITFDQVERTRYRIAVNVTGNPAADVVLNLSE